MPRRCTWGTFRAGKGCNTGSAHPSTAVHPTPGCLIHICWSWLDMVASAWLSERVWHELLQENLMSRHHQGSVGRQEHMENVVTRGRGDVGLRLPAAPAGHLHSWAVLYSTMQAHCSGESGLSRPVWQGLQRGPKCLC